MRARVESHRHADLVSAPADGIVEFGGGIDHLAPVAGAGRRGAAERACGAGKGAEEAQPFVGPGEILWERSPVGETGRARDGIGYKLEAADLQCLGEGGRINGVAADHLVGDLDALVAGSGDRVEDIVGLARPGVAQHLPRIGLATQFHLAILVRRRWNAAGLRLVRGP